MTKKEIRLQYTGFVIFAAKMASVLTGLIFQFIIARSLIPVSADGKTEYDLWLNVNDVIAYFTLLASVLPFWTMRFVSREKEGAIKTGILANLTISAAAIIIYLMLISTVISALGITGQYLPIYFVTSLQIIELHSIYILEACLQAKMPQTIGYGLLLQQICKVVFGYILIFRLNQQLFGAIITSIVAFALQAIYYFKLLASELKQKIRWEYAKEWLKGSLVNIYNVVGNQIAAYIFIILFSYGGEGARGRYGAAAIVVTVITYSSFLAFALYPKLLAERKREDITASLKMVLMFAIPLTVGAIALADSYITILTEFYTDSALVLVVLAIDSFVIVVSGIFNTVLLGVETVDEGAKISLYQLAKSRLFIVFSLPYIHSAITLPTTFYALTVYAQGQPLLAALYVGIINSSARFVMFLVLYAIVRKMIKIDIPWGSIAKYASAAAIMGALLYVIPHPTRISLTVGMTVFGGIVYLALLMLIDKEARGLIFITWQEVKSKIMKKS